MANDPTPAASDDRSEKLDVHAGEVRGEQLHVLDVVIRESIERPKTRWIWPGKPGRSQHQRVSTGSSLAVTRSRVLFCHPCRPQGPTTREVAPNGLGVHHIRSSSHGTTVRSDSGGTDSAAPERPQFG